MRVCLLSLVAPIFRCVVARCGCACTVAVRGTLLGTAPGLGCEVGASGRRFGSAQQPALPAAWRFWAPLVVLLPVVADAAAVSGASLLGALLSVGLLVLA